MATKSEQKPRLRIRVVNPPTTSELLDDWYRDHGSTWTMIDREQGLDRRAGGKRRKRD